MKPSARLVIKTDCRAGGEGRPHVEKMVTLRLEAWREDDLYVAICPDLDVSSYGDSVEDAFAHLKDSISLYLETIEQDGERERVFRERRIEIDERPETKYNVTLHPGVFATISRFTVRVA